jgi:glycosyltransferase involved in cell wall biosynthesis
MHIALVHDALIPPPKYGGTERIIAWLARALLKLGHRVTLVAREGSRIKGAEFIAHSGDWESRLSAGVDVAHLWSTPGAPPRLPFLVTIEGNGRPGEVFHPNTLFISRRHAENHGATRFVYNGIDPDDYRCEERRESYAVFLAKASWKVKNLEGAIAVARAAGTPLEVLGSRDWPLGLQKRLPRIRGVRYHGMVGDADKREILSRARALIFPVRWHEPFGIAVTEALASGCFVLGTPYGSLPEIITPDVGFLSTDGGQLAARLREPGRFTPAACRARVSAGFSDLDMARAYLPYYENVISCGRLEADANKAPATAAGLEGLSSNTLLPWENPQRV